MIRLSESVMLDFDFLARPSPHHDFAEFSFEIDDRAAKGIIQVLNNTPLVKVIQLGSVKDWLSRLPADSVTVRIATDDDQRFSVVFPLDGAYEALTRLQDTCNTFALPARWAISGKNGSNSETVEALARSPAVRPLPRLDWPYDDVTFQLVASCTESSESWLKLIWLAAPHDVMHYERSVYSLNRRNRQGNRARQLRYVTTIHYRIDHGLAQQTHGFYTLTESHEGVNLGDVIHWVESFDANEVTFELRFADGKHHRITFPLLGARQALSALLDGCSLGSAAK